VAIDGLVRDFLARRRAGEELSVETFAAAHPAEAEELRRVLPTLLALAGVGSTEAWADAFEADTPPDAPTPPKEVEEGIGPYAIVREVGHGGMGVVFECVGPDGARVAVKRMHARLASDPRFAVRFLRESEVGRRIRSPHVVRCLDLGATPGPLGLQIPYLVLEFVEGRSLEEMAEDAPGGRIPEDHLRPIAEQVCRGLTAVHAEGVIHRDVKPGNVFVTPEGRALLMDLGVARPTTRVAPLTMAGEFVGSMAYAAPEQFEDDPERLGPWTDLFSLGATLHEMATGLHPYVSQMMNDATEAEAHLTPFFRRVLATLRDPEPSRRFPSAERLREVLAEGESGPWARAARPGR
jgi:serine/threonine protein kinase